MSDIETKQSEENAQGLSVQREIQYYEEVLSAIDKKLGTEKFIRFANPVIVQRERNKRADVQSKLDLLRLNLDSVVVDSEI